MNRKWVYLPDFLARRLCPTALFNVSPGCHPWSKGGLIDIRLPAAWSIPPKSWIPAGPCENHPLPLIKSRGSKSDAQIAASILFTERCPKPLVGSHFVMSSDGHPYQPQHSSCFPIENVGLSEKKCSPKFIALVPHLSCHFMAEFAANLFAIFNEAHIILLTTCSIYPMVSPLWARCGWSRC